MMQPTNGKGSVQRPTDKKRYEDNYDKIKWTNEPKLMDIKNGKKKTTTKTAS